MSNSNPAQETATKVITGEVRFSYVHVWEPYAIAADQKPKYSVVLLIKKSDKKTIAKIQAAVEAAKQQGKGSKFGGRIPANLKLPLRDGDEERPEDETYAGHLFVTANDYRKPGIVDRQNKQITDQEEFYSGCYGFASVTFYPFKAGGNIGVACGLNNLMKTRDGEALTSRTTAESDFSDIELPEDAEDLL